MRLATLVQMTVPGAPCIYYGDEIGLPGGFDPDCRRAFPWDRPQAWDRELLAYVSAAARLRHESPVLRRGAFRILAAEGSSIAYLRRSDDAAVVVALNNGDEPVTIELALAELEGRLLEPVPLPGDASSLPGAAVRDGRVTIVIPARAGRVLRA